MRYEIKQNCILTFDTPNTVLLEIILYLKKYMNKLNPDRDTDQNSVRTAKNTERGEVRKGRWRRIQ